MPAEMHLAKSSTMRFINSLPRTRHSVLQEWRGKSPLQHSNGVRGDHVVVGLPLRQENSAVRVLHHSHLPLGQDHQRGGSQSLEWVGQNLQRRWVTIAGTGCLHHWNTHLVILSRKPLGNLSRFLPDQRVLQIVLWAQGRILRIAILLADMGSPWQKGERIKGC